MSIVCDKILLFSVIFLQINSFSAIKSSDVDAAVEQLKNLGNEDEIMQQFAKLHPKEEKKYHKDQSFFKKKNSHPKNEPETITTHNQDSSANEKVKVLEQQVNKLIAKLSNANISPQAETFPKKQSTLLKKQRNINEERNRMMKSIPEEFYGGNDVDDLYQEKESTKDEIGWFLDDSDLNNRYSELEQPRPVFQTNEEYPLWKSRSTSYEMPEIFQEPLVRRVREDPQYSRRLLAYRSLADQEPYILNQENSNTSPLSNQLYTRLKEKQLKENILAYTDLGMTRNKY